jgi:hypothetical protein
VARPTDTGMFTVAYSNELYSYCGCEITLTISLNKHIRLSTTTWNLIADMPEPRGRRDHLKFADANCRLDHVGRRPTRRMQRQRLQSIKISVDAHRLLLGPSCYLLSVDTSDSYEDGFFPLAMGRGFSHGASAPKCGVALVRGPCAIALSARLLPLFRAVFSSGCCRSCYWICFDLGGCLLPTVLARGD